MSEISSFELLTLIRIYIFDANLILIALPIYKMIKRKIRCYQTPFLFVFALIADNLTWLGTYIFIDRDIASKYYNLWIGVAVALIISIAIIFGDHEFSIGIKIVILFVFLIIETLFFLAPLVIKKDGIKYISYILVALYTIGPIECLIGSLILKKHSILPILNLFLLFSFNALGIYPFVFEYLVIIRDVGFISCFIQIVVYFVLRRRRINKNSSHSESFSNQVENIPSEPLCSP